MGLSVRYLIDHDTIATPELFMLTDDEYEDFISFMEQQEFDGRSATQIVLEQLLSVATREGYDSALLNQLNEMKKVPPESGPKTCCAIRQRLKGCSKRRYAPPITIKKGGFAACYETTFN